MRKAAKEMNFERAAQLRDMVDDLRRDDEADAALYPAHAAERDRSGGGPAGAARMRWG